MGADNHPITDLTFTTPNVALNWSIAEEEAATGSDHEVIGWEVLGFKILRHRQWEERVGQLFFFCFVILA